VGCPPVIVQLEFQSGFNFDNSDAISTRHRTRAFLDRDMLSAEFFDILSA
jgi:hypothetical protein